MVPVLQRTPPPVALGAYGQKGDAASRPLAQQLVQLLLGDGVGDQAEDEEAGEDDAQGPTQKRVQTDAFVVRHIRSAGKQTESAFNIGRRAAASYLLAATARFLLLLPDADCGLLGLQRFNAHLSLSNLLLMVEQTRSESFSS